MKVANKKIFEYFIDNELQIEEIIKDYTNYVYTIISKSCINFSNEDLEEVISDVFFTIWNNQSKLDINKDISPYVAGVTKKLVMKKLRNNDKNDSIQNYVEKLVSSSNVELEIYENEVQKNILNVLENLKSDDKEVFIKYYYENRKINEIAIACGMSESKVKSKLFRIRKRIRKFLKDRSDIV